MKHSLDTLCFKVVRQVSGDDGLPIGYTSLYTSGIAKFTYGIGQTTEAPAEFPMFVYEVPETPFKYNMTLSLRQVCNEWRPGRSLLLCFHTGLLPAPKHFDIDIFQIYKNKFLSWGDIKQAFESNGKDDFWGNKHARGTLSVTPLMVLKDLTEETTLLDAIYQCREFIA